MKKLAHKLSANAIFFIFFFERVNQRKVDKGGEGENEMANARIWRRFLERTMVVLGKKRAERKEAKSVHKFHSTSFYNVIFKHKAAAVALYYYGLATSAALLTG